MESKPRYKATYVVSEIREIINGWKIKGETKFNTFDELKTYLIEHTNELFSWINDNVDDYEDYRKLPNFKDVETVRDINTILDNFNYGWWFVKVHIIAVEQGDENE